MNKILLFLFLIQSTNSLAVDIKYWDVRRGKIYHCIKTPEVEKCSKFPNKYFRDKVIVIPVNKHIIS